MPAAVGGGLGDGGDEEEEPERSGANRQEEDEHHAPHVVCRRGQEGHMIFKILFWLTIHQRPVCGHPEDGGGAGDGRAIARQRRRRRTVGHDLGDPLAQRIVGPDILRRNSKQIQPLKNREDEVRGAHDEGKRRED